MKMIAWKGPARVLALGVLLASLALAGCRTYGRYGNKAGTLEQIRQANELFAEQLERARADGNLLARAAQDHAALKPFADRYRTLLLTHEAFLAENEELAAPFVNGDLDSYRALNQAFGTILSRQQIVHNQYAGLRRAIAHLGDTTASPGGAVTAAPRFTKARYRFVPVYYHQVSNTARALTMREALEESGRVLPPAAPEAAERPSEVPAVDTAGH